MDGFKSRSRQLRAAQTSAEMRLWRALRRRRLASWKFRRQHAIDRFVVDFVTIDGMLIVEVDGATHWTKKAMARDVERTRILESLGLRVIRVTNGDVYDNLEGVLEMLMNELALPTR